MYVPSPSLRLFNHSPRYFSFAAVINVPLPFLLPFLKKCFREVEFLDPAEEVAIRISKLKQQASKRNSLLVYTTKSPKALQRNLKKMGISNKVTLFS